MPGADAGDPVRVARPFLASLVGAGPLIVAVSGGGDSMALLSACRELLSGGRLAPRRLIAATVDHGLRPGSAAEARQVGAYCAALGVEHEILQWTGKKPAAGVQAAARMARYRLLGQLAGGAGAVGIATAHTLDDQRETLAMRAARSPADEGSRGLAGMAPATLYDRSHWILRPFLCIGRDDLRRWLTARGIGWMEDPSNEDERFERVRLRREGSTAASPEAGAPWQAARRLANRATAAVIEERGRGHGGFLASLDLSGADRRGQAVANAAALLMAIAGGRPYLPGREAARRLSAFIEAGAPGRFSASRSIAELRGSRLYIYRERRSLHPLHVAPGEKRLYDGRYVVEVTGGDAIELAIAGPETIAALRNHPEFGGIPPGVAGRAFAAEPVLRRGGRVSCIWRAELPGVEARRHFAPFDVFLPLFDYILANRSVALFGQDPYPPPPIAAPAVRNSNKPVGSPWQWCG